MSGQRNTGTVPKTKHNTRPRRENPVNHIPNNLEWHPEYRPRRVQKESNNYPIFLPEAGNDFSYEPSWGSGLGPSNRTDDDELRWSSVKSSNITPKRGEMESHQASRMNRPENHDERLVPESLKAQMARGRFKVKLEQSKKRMEELQQQQAALMSLRHKAIQQVKPVQMEELHPPVALRSKAIQQVKPVQQKECEKIAKLSERMDDHMMQILKVMENEIEPQTDQQVRNKLNELMAKKAQCDKLLCCLESDVPGCPASPSSEEAENERNDFHENEVTLGAVGGEAEELHQNIESRHQWDGASNSRREAEKQDNREFDNMAAISAYIENKEMKLEEVMSKFEELQTLMGHMEKLRDLKLTTPSNGLDNQPEPLQPTRKNSQAGAVEKHEKKVDMSLDSRQLNSYPPSTQSADAHGYQNMFDLTSETWAASSWNGAPPVGDSSSDDGEVEYDESPVKLCSSVLRQPSRFPKFRRSTQPNTVNGHATFKPATSPVSHHQNSLEPRVRQRVQPDESHTPHSNSSLSYQINQLQMQMEQMYSLYQNLVEKQTSNYAGPQPWIPPPNPHPSYLPFMGGGSMGGSGSWQQHQILVNSLNQCCQLIWHQQKELTALRQALAMLQDESVYKCGGYGNNLNFESGLLWSQTSPQTLNNQVPPGNRANNYWDNFRSYSRQNLLSGRNKSNEGSIADTSTLPGPPPGPPPPMQPSSTQTENNLQTNRKENSTENSRGRRESLNNNRNSNRRPMRSYNNNPSADSWSVHSLEQSIYSELETVLSERNPNALIQLLSHLRVLRSSQPFDALHSQNGDLGDQSLPNFIHSPEQTFANPPQLLTTMPLPQQPPNVQNLEEKYNQYCLQDDSMSKILAELSKIIDSKESDVCTPEFLQQLVNFLTEKINPQIVPKLEASLLKFQGTSLDQLGHVLLCDVAAVIWSHISNQPKQQQQGNMQVLVEQEVEEGAVGGVPLNSQQNVDAELAEADQPQHNSSNNSEAFWGAEIDIPTLEMDNQELPPQENDPSFQNAWLPGGL